MYLFTKNGSKIFCINDFNTSQITTSPHEDETEYFKTISQDEQYYKARMYCFTDPDRVLELGFRTATEIDDLITVLSGVKTMIKEMEDERC